MICSLFTWPSVASEGSKLCWISSSRPQKLPLTETPLWWRCILAGIWQTAPPYCQNGVQVLCTAEHNHQYWDTIVELHVLMCVNAIVIDVNMSALLLLLYLAKCQQDGPHIWECLHLVQQSPGAKMEFTPDRSHTHCSPTQDTRIWVCDRPFHTHTETLPELWFIPCYQNQAKSKEYEGLKISA